MTEETRYWGLTDAEREAALAADSPARAAGGWRVANRRTEFAFGKPGMNLVVTWVNGAAEASAGSSAPAAAHFDLNGAIAAATRDMTGNGVAAAPVPATVPAPAPAPAPVPAAPVPAAAAPEPEPDLEPPADRFEDSSVVAPTFTAHEATDSFGPNGADVVWLLDSLATLDRETATEIANAYSNADEEIRDEALRSMTTSFSRPPYAGWMKAAEDLVDSWVESVGATGNDEVVYDTVASAAIDAVDALIAQSELDADTFTTLYEPWGSVMDPADEEPEGEEPVDDDSAPAIHDHSDATPGAEFGPNTDHVIEFLDALRCVTPGQIDELVKTGTAEWESRLNVARGRLDDAMAEKPEYRAQCDAVAEEIAAWVDRRAGVQFDYSDGETSTIDRQAAQPAVVDAAQTLVMVDLLEPDDAKDLYSAWAYAVGSPPLPEFGDADGPPEAEATGPDTSDLGPSGEELGLFFSALASLEPEQVAELGAPLLRSDATRFDGSWGQAVEIAAEKSEYRAQFELVVREVMAWRDGATGKYADYRHLLATKADRERARNRILRCAVSLLYADLLAREDAERLYGPWLSIVGEPPLPEYTNG